ncbi:MAG: TrbC/VirB2 family protein [Algiphilus sp.]|jgi:type IV secretory pathway VirB2 component (pilin)
MTGACNPDFRKYGNPPKRTSLGSVFRLRRIYGNPQSRNSGNAPIRKAALPDLNESAFPVARLFGFTVLLTATALPNLAHAAGSGMPWEAPLQAIVESIEGPVAKIVAVIIIIVTGLTLAFGDTAGGFRRLVQIVFGLSIAFAASSFFLTFFAFGGGALV